MAGIVCYQSLTLFSSLRSFPYALLFHLPSSSVYGLRNLNLPIPYYKHHASDLGGGGTGGEGGHPRSLVADSSRWTCADVCKWVGRQDFKMYRAMFKTALVNGSVLEKLDDGHLEEMGITSRIHRTVVLTAIEDLLALLKEAAVASSEEGEDTVGRLLRSPSGRHETIGRRGTELKDEEESTLDVFLSYRRKGGSQLAQLIKVYLKLRGFTVFLDVDNLGRGAFDTALEKNLYAAKNVVVLLTPGCLDRCITDKEGKDFVRREIAIALAAGKNVIPVTDSFDWPAVEELPEDIQDLCRQNAVAWSHGYQDASVDKLCSFIHTSMTTE